MGVIVLLIVAVWVFFTLVVIAFFRGASLASRAEDRQRAAEQEQVQREAGQRVASGDRGRTDDAALFVAFDR